MPKTSDTQVDQDNRLRFTDINTIAKHPFVSLDLARFILGDRIGNGAYRVVYKFDFVPNTVIKVTMDPEANVNEFNTWVAVKGTTYAKWFAPCLWISPCGNFMVQRRIKPVKPGDKMPKTMPGGFTDFKRSNFGWIGKQLVCHDYQFISTALETAFNTRQKVTWKP